jgi:hypothetical protein
VFAYERLKHLSRVRIARFRGLLERTVTKVKTGGHLRISEHEEDNRIYECALAAKPTISSPRIPGISKSPTRRPGL